MLIRIAKSLLIKTAKIKLSVDQVKVYQAWCGPGQQKLKFFRLWQLRSNLLLFGTATDSFSANWSGQQSSHLVLIRIENIILGADCHRADHTLFCMLIMGTPKDKPSASLGSKDQLWCRLWQSISNLVLIVTAKIILGADCDSKDQPCCSLWQ